MLSTALNEPSGAVAEVVARVPPEPWRLSATQLTVPSSNGTGARRGRPRLIDASRSSTRRSRSGSSRSWVSIIRKPPPRRAVPARFLYLR
ncbi:hypothetical protein H010_09146 [Hydrogenophaga taeniospiralis CCUG 15921]|uniref:Uncharacterized protein n=1 Tax=Hydrogenophaga taeniospiralis CCUG 15921 TaxID=1281780 RepID=A0A9X4NPR1_9BURK|nr:hypothetical protein [Hydrogenophaga taeniospiralis CCUG 15921]